MATYTTLRARRRSPETAGLAESWRALLIATRSRPVTSIAFRIVYRCGGCSFAAVTDSAQRRNRFPRNVLAPPKLLRTRRAKPEQRCPKVIRTLVELRGRLPGINIGRRYDLRAKTSMIRSTLSDDDLVRLMLGGDESAFVALYGRRQGGVYRFALHMSGDPSVAEEVVQEVFMQLIRNPAQYEPDRGSLAALLYGMARNYVLRIIERDRRYLPLAEDVSDDESWGANGSWVGIEDPLADLTRAETIERVRQTVLGLPATYREVVVLCDLEELDYAEAARVLGCPVGTVRSRLHRARTLLMGKLRALQQGEASLNRGRA